MLAHGAEVDAPDVFQITPLMAAAGMSGAARGGVGSGGGPGHPQCDVQARAIETIDLLLGAGAKSTRASATAIPTLPKWSPTYRAATTKARRQSSPPPSPGG